MKTNYIVVMKHLGQKPFIMYCQDKEQLNLRIHACSFDGTKVLDSGCVDAMWKTAEAVARLRQEHGVNTIVEIKKIQ